MDNMKMIEPIKRRAIRRTKIIAGQIGGLEKMIEDEKYCLDIINQSLAIQKSLASLNELLLENHIRTHLSHQLGSNDEVIIDQAIGEMMKLYELNNIKGANKK